VGWDAIIGPDDGEGWALPYQDLKWGSPVNNESRAFKQENT
jgi:hypothetical protein